MTQHLHSLCPHSADAGLSLATLSYKGQGTLVVGWAAVRGQLPIYRTGGHTDPDQGRRERWVLEDKRQSLTPLYTLVPTAVLSIPIA